VITTKSIEREVNRIRLEIHEETRDMTPEQRKERLEKIASEAQKEFGFERIASARGKAQ
jgi:intein-encoded DNA endonuclease-like protein